MRGLTIVLITCVVSVLKVHAQNPITPDEILRKKLAVDYLEVMLFNYESAAGEAVAGLLVKAFKEEMVIAPIDVKVVTLENDKVKIAALEYALKKLISDPAPTWEQLVEAEKNFLILKDKQQTRHSKYKQE